MNGNQKRKCEREKNEIIAKQIMKIATTTTAKMEKKTYSPL